MKKSPFFPALAAVVALAYANVNMAETITLTQNTAAGSSTSPNLTFSATDDAYGMDNSFLYKLISYGGNADQILVRRNGSGGMEQLGLLRFDLSKLPKVKSIDSATLRLYQFTNSTAATTIPFVARLKTGQSWVQGNGTGGADAESGASGASYARRKAIRFFKRDGTPGYSSMDVGGKTVYYFTVPVDLAPLYTATTNHFIGRANAVGDTFAKATDIGSRLLTQAANLTDLANTLPATTRCYYYNAGTKTVYLNFNDYSVSWLSTDDIWADTKWGSGTGGAPGTNTYDNASKVSATAAVGTGGGWFTFNVKAIVTDWVVNGKENNGFFMWDTNTGDVRYRPSEHAIDGLRPELVIEYTPKPPSGTVIMLF